MATKADKTELAQMGEKLSLGGTLVEQIDSIKLVSAYCALHLSLLCIP